MKRILALLFILSLCLTNVCLAESPTAEELQEQIAALQAQLEALQEEAGTDTAESSTTDSEYDVLQQGSKGDAVVQLQKRLIELNYLSGSADGDYGNKTRVAVERFQQDAQLDATGIADVDTQKALYADDAPVAKNYEKLDYKSILRDPNAYEGRYFTFSGHVFQLVGEQEVGDTVYTVLFVATRGKYDNICRVTYYRPASSPRILEDDTVTVYAECDGLYTYETVRGNSNTILAFTADSIS